MNICQNKIDVLWITRFLPDSQACHAGGKTFKYYFNSFLSDSRFDITLMGCYDGKKNARIEEEFKDIKHDFIYYDASEHRIAEYISRYNPWDKYFRMISGNSVKRILNVLREYKKKGYCPDCIILEWTNIVILAKEIHKIFPESILVASEADVAFIGYKRVSEYAYRKGSWWAKRWTILYEREKRKELEALRICDLVLPHNDDNANVLSQEGIDRDKIQWLVPYYQDMSAVIRKSNHRDILFFGVMNRKENYLSAMWFIDNVMPKLKDIDVRFIVLGIHPIKELFALKSDRVHITGYVEDVIKYFKESMCFVAPLVLGAGIKVKVLEALSSGIPVLTNDIGIEGIAAKEKEDYLHCTTADEYADTIKLIYDGSIDTEVLKENAKKCLQRYSIEDSARRYKDKLCSLKNSICKREERK